MCLADVLLGQEPRLTQLAWPAVDWWATSSRAKLFAYRDRSEPGGVLVSVPVVSSGVVLVAVGRRSVGEAGYEPGALWSTVETVGAVVPSRRGLPYDG